MKGAIGLFCLVTSLLNALAHDESLWPNETAYYVEPVVYEPSVVYNGPVVYNAPVVYNGPVVYSTPVPHYSLADFGSDSPSVVIYIGSGRSHLQVNFGIPGSTVLYFGNGQATRQGYCFDCR